MRARGSEKSSRDSFERLIGGHLRNERSLGWRIHDGNKEKSDVRGVKRW